MKKYFNKEGKEFKFGDIVNYSEKLDNDGLKMSYDVNVTLCEESLPFLKEIGAIIEKEIAEPKKKPDLLKNYEKILADTIGGTSRDHKVVPADLGRFFSLFPAQYISLVMNLIKQDRDRVTPEHYGYIFDISNAKVRLFNTENILNKDYLNVFSSIDKLNECLDIIKPLLDKYYGK